MTDDWNGEIYYTDSKSGQLTQILLKKLKKLLKTQILRNKLKFYSELKKFCEFRTYI